MKWKSLGLSCVVIFLTLYEKSADAYTIRKNPFSYTPYPFSEENLPFYSGYEPQSLPSKWLLPSLGSNLAFGYSFAQSSLIGQINDEIKPDLQYCIPSSWLIVGTSDQCEVAAQKFYQTVLSSNVSSLLLQRPIVLPSVQLSFRLPNFRYLDPDLINYRALYPSLLDSQETLRTSSIQSSGFALTAADADFTNANTDDLSLTPIPLDEFSATPKAVPEPIPTPAFLSGLLGMGIAALRKRKQ